MEMKRLNDVIAETERFLAVCKAAKRNHDRLGTLSADWNKDHPGTTSYWDKNRIDPGKHTGAVKRASMDLSRALVTLRRP